MFCLYHFSVKCIIKKNYFPSLMLVPHKQLCYRKTNAANFTKLPEHVYQTTYYNDM